MRAMTGHAVNQYLHLSHNLTTPVVNLNPYGYNYMQGSFPIERVCSLSLMQTKIRTPLAIEKWSPLELSLFETSMSLYGKQFNLVSKSVKTKTVREVIELYYLWKKSDHYKSWKRGFECLIDAEEDVGGLEGDNSGEVI
ncbi:hypothetical protein TrLO_g13911 [Triparma laevis f. longispina]|uniref:SANT domain-containing protein n=2 Tax=Triparma laevis TaxID=1534972 RepID=A0A9W6ZGU8_9STRA|nr:hypothetical protein TrLO_g13911 [Triparma laevis f. longispina]